ncbi:hypothetical protein GT020_19210 [Glutamicibacter soli]|nr:hypothetical protein [Glutamicibacter soli]
MPEIIRQRMKNVAVDKQQSIKQGIEIAKELLDTALTHFQGIYLVTPFMRYDISIQLVNYIHKSLEINHSSMMKRI